MDIKALITHWQNGLATKPVAALKLLIILWSVMVVVIALSVNNPLILAAIFLYEALP
jgi:hypothetical protein